jgi:hypothetical protein
MSCAQLWDEESSLTQHHEDSSQDGTPVLTSTHHYANSPPCQPRRSRGDPQPVTTPWITTPQLLTWWEAPSWSTSHARTTPIALSPQHKLHGLQHHRPLVPSADVRKTQAASGDTTSECTSSHVYSNPSSGTENIIKFRTGIIYQY